MLPETTANLPSTSAVTVRSAWPAWTPVVKPNGTTFDQWHRSAPFAAPIPRPAIVPYADKLIGGGDASQWKVTIYMQLRIENIGHAVKNLGIQLEESGGIGFYKCADIDSGTMTEYEYFLGSALTRLGYSTLNDATVRRRLAPHLERIFTRRATVWDTLWELHHDHELPFSLTTMEELVVEAKQKQHDSFHRDAAAIRALFNGCSYCQALIFMLRAAFVYNATVKRFDFSRFNGLILA